MLEQALGNALTNTVHKLWSDQLWILTQAKYFNCIIRLLVWHFLKISGETTCAISISISIKYYMKIIQATFSWHAKPHAVEWWEGRGCCCGFTHYEPSLLFFYVSGVTILWLFQSVKTQKNLSQVEASDAFSLIKMIVITGNGESKHTLRCVKGTTNTRECIKSATCLVQITWQLSGVTAWCWPEAALQTNIADTCVYAEPLHESWSTWEFQSVSGSSLVKLQCVG